MRKANADAVFPIDAGKIEQESPKRFLNPDKPFDKAEIAYGSGKKRVNNEKSRIVS